MLPGIEFVAQHWPYYNESIKSGVANHFVPTNCDDGGFGKSADIQEYMVLNSKKIGPGEPWANALPHYLRWTILLSCNGCGNIYSASRRFVTLQKARVSVDD